MMSFTFLTTCLQCGMMNHSLLTMAPWETEHLTFLLYKHKTGWVWWSTRYQVNWLQNSDRMIPHQVPSDACKFVVWLSKVVMNQFLSVVWLPWAVVHWVWCMEACYKVLVVISELRGVITAQYAEVATPVLHTQKKGCVQFIFTCWSCLSVSSCVCLSFSCA